MDIGRNGTVGHIRLRPTGVAWRELDGESVILDLDNSCYLTANGTGTLLLRRMGEGTTRETLVQALCEEYAIDEPTAAADVDRFLAHLSEAGLLDGDG